MTEQTMEKEAGKKEEQEEVRKVEGIPGGVLKALHSHTAERRVRWSLDCIRLEGRELVAADGAVLARLSLPEDLGPAELFKFPKPALRKRQPVEITRQNGQLRIEQADGASVRQETYEAEGDSGRWPEHYREVIPGESTGTQVRCSIAYLKQALELLDCAGYTGARLTFQGEPNQPFRVDGLKAGGQAEHDIGVTVVISPLSEE